MKRLISRIELNSMPDAPKERLRVFTDAFGELVYNLIDYAIEGSRNLLEDEAFRKKIGRIKAEPFAYIATHFNADERKMVLMACRDSIEVFADLLIGYLDNAGTDLVLDDEHVAQFRLTLEVVNREADKIVREEVLSKTEVGLSEQLFRWKRLHHEKSNQPPDGLT